MPVPDDYQCSSTTHDADDERHGRMLLERMVAGDGEAVEAFLDLYEASVCRYICHIVPGISDDDLSDIVQETFIAALRSAHAYRGEARLATWLLRIAHHKVSDWLRRRRVQRWLSLSLLGEEPAETFLQETPSEDDVWLVRLALGKLPRDQRQAVVLRYVMGLSVGEVAATMRIARRKVEWLITQGRAALRALLGGEK
ncbi:MAG: RNA polymerase sigma factor [Thermoflexales bacterium]|nr:RNA polymerase sigma factor [Thermoflexales bacterium]